MNPEWMYTIDRINVALSAYASLAAAGKMEAYYAAISAMFDAQIAAEAAAFSATAGAGAVAAGAIPIVAAVGVWVALGSGYYEAQQIIKKRESMSGFADGYVCGILRWKFNQTIDKFRRNPFNKDDETAAYAYSDGLRTGYTAGIALPLADAKNLAKVLRKAAGISLPNAEEWRNNRRMQIDFVINLSVAARKEGYIKES
jgi:hypothetical protein